MIELDEIRLPTLSERETLELQTEVLSELALEGSARRAGAVFCERLAHRAGADRCILFAREFRASGDWTVIARSDSNDAEGIETVCSLLGHAANRDLGDIVIDTESRDGTNAKLVITGTDTQPGSAFVDMAAHLGGLLVQSFTREQRFKRYRSVFRATADLACMLSADLRCVAANHGLASLLETDVVELERKPIERIFGDDYAELLQPAIEGAFDGRAATLHEWITFPTGRRLYADVEINPHRNPLGQVEAVLIRLFDVTNKHRAFQALARSEEKYRTLVESMTDFVWEIDLEGRFVSVNSGTGRILGYQQEDLLGRHFVDFMTGEEKDRSTEVLKSMREDPRPLRGLINHMRHRDGSAVTLEGTILPMRGENGELVGFRGIERDVTQTERQQRLRRRLEAIIEATPDFVSTSDAEGRLQYINRSGRALLGFNDPSEYAGKQLEIVHPPEDHRKIREEGLVEARRTGSWQGEVRLRRVDGTLIPVSQVILVHRGSNGEVVYYSTIMRDLTERLSAEAKLKAYAEDLRRVSQRLFTARENELRHLARELHDEIGQSLTALKINLDRIQMSGSPNPQSMRSCLDLLETLLGRVRNMSLDLRPTMLDDLGLEASLRWFVERFRNTALLEVECDIAAGLGRFPPTLETACFRIAQEALTNTLRHATAKKAFIRLRSDATYLQLSVGDDGQGFDVEQRLRDARWGHSFGLAGMHERASLLGGELKIVSNPGGGTVIHASLPY